MFRLRRDDARNHKQLLRNELGESFDHAMRAAGHAAGGVKAASTQVRPTAGRVRDAASQRWGTTVSAFNDAADAAEKRSKKAKKAMRDKSAPGSRRWPRLAGLLAAGAAVGATGALVMRRRRQQQWAEYDPDEALEAASEAAASETAGGETPSSEAPSSEAPSSGPAAGVRGADAAPADELVSRSGGSAHHGG